MTVQEQLERCWKSLEKKQEQKVYKFIICLGEQKWDKKVFPNFSRDFPQLFPLFFPLIFSPIQKSVF